MKLEISAPILLILSGVCAYFYQFCEAGGSLAIWLASVSIIFVVISVILFLDDFINGDEL